MTREDIIRMAREARFESHDISLNFPKELERFATLVAAAERNRTWTQDHWTEYERSIAAAERDRMCEQFNISKELAHEKAKSNETD